MNRITRFQRTSGLRNSLLSQEETDQLRPPPPPVGPVALVRLPSASDDPARIITEAQAVVDNFYHFKNNPYVLADSSEGILMKLIACYKIKFSFPSNEALLGIPSASSLDAEIDNLRCQLFSNLVDEGYLHDNSPCLTKLNYSLDAIRSRPDASFHDELSRNVYFKLLNLLRPIDINRLLILVDRAKQAEGEIRNKKAILLLGNTGSGKSTLTHFLCGSTFEMQNGKLFPVVNSYRDSLDKVRIGISDVESETLYVTAVPVTHSRSGEIFYICDTPGFLDARGAEIQLANGQGIVQAVKNAAEVYPVLLFNDGCTSDNWTNFRTMLKTVAAFIPFANLHLDAFSYVFTKGWSASHITEIHSAIDRIINTLPQADPTNTSYIALLEDMRNKTDPLQPRNKVHFFDPLSTDFSSDQLLTTIVESNTVPIRECATNFEFIPTAESVEALRKECSMIEHVIGFTLDSSRFNFPVMNYHLTLTKLLDQAIPQTYIQCTAMNCISRINQALQDYLSVRYELVKTVLFSVDPVTVEQQENILLHCRNFLNALQDIDRAKNVLVKHSNDFPCFEEEKKLINNIEQTFESLISTVVGHQTTIENIDLDLLKVRLDKLKIAMDTFADKSSLLQTIFTMAISRIRQLYDLIEVEFRNHLNNWEIFDCCTDLDVMRFFEISIGANYGLNTPYTNAIAFFNTAVTKEAVKMDAIFASTLLLTSEDMKLFNTVALNLDSVFMYEVPLRNHFPIDDVSKRTFVFTQIRNEFIDKVIAFVNRIVSGIAQLVDNGGEELDQIRLLFGQITTIANMQSLNNFSKFSEVHISRITAKGHLVRLSETLMKTIAHSIELLAEHRSTSTSISALARHLANFRRTSLLQEEYNFDLKSIEKINTRIDDAYRSLCQRARNVQLSIRSVEKDVSDVAQMLTQLELSKILNDFLSKELQADMEATKHFLNISPKEALISVNEFITTTPTPQDVKHGFVEDVRLRRRFMDYCEKYCLLDTADLELRNRFNTFLSKYWGAVQRETERLFAEICSFGDDLQISRKLEEEMWNKASEFARCIKQFKQFHDHQFGDGYFELWCDGQESKLESYLSSLQKDLFMNRRSKNLSTFSRGAKIAALLSKVDHYLTSEAKFSALSLQFYGALETLNNTLNHQITISIQSKDYAGAAAAIRALRYSNDADIEVQYKHFASELFIQLSRLRSAIIESCKRFVRFQDMALLEQLMEKIQCLRRAWDEVYDLAETQTNIDLLLGNDFELEVATVLMGYVEKNRDIEPYLKAHNFIMAVSKVQKIVDFLEALAQINLHRYIIDEEILTIHIESIHTSMQTQICDQLQELEVKFTTLPVASLHVINPHAIFSQFKNPELYDYEKYNQRFVEALAKNIVQQCETIKTLQDSKEEKLRQLESLGATITVTCPEIAEVVNPTLERIRASIRASYELFVQQVTGLLQNPRGSASELYARFQEAKSMRNSEVMNLILNYLSLEISKLRSGIAEGLKDERQYANVVSTYNRLEELRVAKIEEIFSPLVDAWNEGCGLICAAVTSFKRYSFKHPLGVAELQHAREDLLLIKELIQRSVLFAIIPAKELLPEFQQLVKNFHKHVAQSYLQILLKNLAENAIKDFYKIVERYNPVTIIFRDFSNERALDYLQQQRDSTNFSTDTTDLIAEIKQQAGGLCTLEDFHQEIAKYSDKFFHNLQEMLKTVTDKTGNRDHRFKHYTTIYLQLQFVVELREAAIEINSEVIDRGIGKISEAVQGFEKGLRTILAPEQNNFTRLSNDSLKQFSFHYDHLKVMLDIFKFEGRASHPLRKEIENAYNWVQRSMGERITHCEGIATSYVANIENQSSNKEQLTIICEAILTLFQMTQFHEDFDSEVRTRVKKLLQLLSPKSAWSLSEVLKESPDGYTLLLGLPDVFESVLNKLRQQATARMGPESAIRQLTGTDYDSNRMRQMYESYGSIFNPLVDIQKLKLLQNKTEVDAYIAKNIITCIDKLTQSLPQLEPSLTYIPWKREIREIAITLIPYIFA